MGEFRRFIAENGCTRGALNSSVTCFSGEVGLLDLARMTIAEHFEERVGRLGSRVEVELAHAANRVNYNQVWILYAYSSRNLVPRTRALRRVFIQQTWDIKSLESEEWGRGSVVGVGVRASVMKPCTPFHIANVISSRRWS